MKMSIKHLPLGKPKKNSYNFQLWTQDWLPVDISPAELVEHITAGKPFAVAQYTDNYRKADNFICSDMIAIDIDAGADHETPLTHAEYMGLLRDPYIVENAFGVIQTASSVKDAYKCRVLFWLDETITNAEEYKDLVKVVMSHIAFADPAPKDAARGFFGGKAGRPADYVALDNQLCVAVLRTELNFLQELERQQNLPSITVNHSLTDEGPKPPRDYGEPDINQVREALRHIPPRLAYQQWLSILMSVHSAFPNEIGIQLIENWSPGYPGEVDAKFASFTKNRVTLGTLFHIAQQYGYRFPSQMPAIFNLTTLQPIIDIVTVHDRYLTNADVPLTETMLIKSPIGTGKTEWIARNISPDDSILILSHRRTLARDLSERFNRSFLDVANYEDYAAIKNRLQIIPRLVITPNSLVKILTSEKTLPRNFRFVILDEMEQVLDHAAGNTLKGAMGVVAHRLMVEVVSKADYVIGADANLTNLSIEWILPYRRKVTVVHNTYPMKYGTMQLYVNREQTVRSLLDDLQTIQDEKLNLPIVIATDSKAEVKTLHLLLSQLGYNGIAIHADNKATAENASFLTNINEQLPSKDYFIYSPTISAGVDIQAEVHTVYGFFRNLSITAEDQLQMLGRARRAARFICYSAYAIRNDETNPQQIKDDYITNLYSSAKMHDLPVRWYNKEKRAIEPDQEEYLCLQCNFWAKHHRYMNRPRPIFRQLVKERFDVTLVPESETPDTELRQQLDNIRKAHRAWEENLILTSDPVNPTAYGYATRNNTVTPEIEYGHQRYEIEEFYGQSITPALLHEATNRSVGGRARLINFINLHRTLHDLEQMDLLEDKKRYAHTARRLDAQKITTIRVLLETVFGSNLHTDKIPEEEFLERLEKFNEAYEGINANRIFHRRTHSEDYPLKRFRWILSLVGLRLKTYRNRHKKTKSYGLLKHRYNDMIANANIRLAYTGEKTRVWVGYSLVQWQDDMRKANKFKRTKRDYQEDHTIPKPPNPPETERKPPEETIPPPEEGEEPPPSQDDEDLGELPF